MNSIVGNAIAGSYVGWPTVLYFHHVHPDIHHYTSISPYHFEKAIELLLKEFNVVVDPSSLCKSTKNWIPEEPSILLTFDDGYKDIMKYAIPILDKYQLKSLLFIINNKVGKSNFNNPMQDFMNQEDIEHLHNEGHVIGAHTLNHYPLNNLDDEQGHYETMNSIEQIRNKLNVPIVHFSYPFGCIPEYNLQFPSETLAFGTVKAQPNKWDIHSTSIRRTYLPIGFENSWPKLIEGWKNQWYE